MRALGPLLFVFTLALCAVRITSAAPSPALVVIVNVDNPAEQVSRKFLTEAFLKKTTRWPHGELIRPVDQLPDAPVRKRFSEEVLKRTVAAVRSYWQQLIFAGRDVPPPEVGSDEQVVQYVLKHSGAVGYVSGPAKPSGVKIVNVE
jgi:ABC-type phosphate transport system substrate-binding protein